MRRLSIPVVLATAGVVLPMAYVENPVIRYLNVADDSVFSYGPVAVMVGALLAVGALLVATGRISRRRTPLDLAVALIAVITLLAAAYGALRHNSALYLLNDLFQLLEFCAFYFIVTTLIQTRQQMVWAFSVLLALTVLSVLLDIAQAIHVWPYKYTAFPRLLPNGSRGLPGLIVPLVVASAAYSRGRLRRPLIAVAALLLFWTVASLTRGMWLSTALAMGFLLLAARDRPGRLAVLSASLRSAGALLAVLVPLLIVIFPVAPHVLDSVGFRFVYTLRQLSAPLPSVQQLQPTATPSIAPTATPATTPTTRPNRSPSPGGVTPAASPSTSAASSPSPSTPSVLQEIEARRQIEAELLLYQIAKSPVLGYGLGATYIGDTGESVKELVIGERHFIHDAYLAMWFRLGLLGLLATLYLIYRVIRTGLRVAYSEPGPWRGVRLGVVAVYVGIAIYSITGDSLIRHPMALFVALGLAAMYLEPARPPEANPEAASAG